MQLTPNIWTLLLLAQVCTLFTPDDCRLALQRCQQRKIYNLVHCIRAPWSNPCNTHIITLYTVVSYNITYKVFSSTHWSSYLNPWLNDVISYIQLVWFFSAFCKVQQDTCTVSCHYHKSVYSILPCLFQYPYSFSRL